MCNKYIGMTFALLAMPWSTFAADLPNHAITSGATDPRVTQGNIHETICPHRHAPGEKSWSKTVRPPANYTNKLKREQIAQYGYSDTNPRDYEEDHLVEISLGGNPTDPRNLWPEPRKTITQWSAEKKDALEYALFKAVCKDEIPLAEAQQALATNWIKAYQKYEGTLLSRYRSPYRNNGEFSE